jgi:DNA-binding PadR family transcriptional regulator
MEIDMRTLTREVFLSLWKVHILHHAGEGPVVGQWMLRELRHHGYEVSPGTMYPLLKRLERNGWIRGESTGNGPKSRREYRLTTKGREVLKRIQDQLDELQGELSGGNRLAGPWRTSPGSPPRSEGSSAGCRARNPL